MSIAEDVGMISDHIDKHGWHQGDYYGPGLTCCIRGAAQRAMKGDTKRIVAAREFIGQTLIENDMLDKPVSDDGMVVLKLWNRDGSQILNEPVAYWNDHIAQDKVEVLSFLDKVQIRAEEKGL